MSTYADICKAECQWCAQSAPFREGEVGQHFIATEMAWESRYPLCTAPTKDQFIERLSADLTAAQERIRLLEGAIEGAPHSEPCNHFRCACSVCGVVVTDHPDFMVMVGDELIPTGVCEGFHWIAGKCNCWKSVLAPKETTDGR